MFLRNYWYIAAMPHEIGRTLLQRHILNEAIVFFRKVDGTPVAMTDTCPHRSMPLSQGKLIGDTLQCAYHGLEFDTQGRCTKIPGQANVPPRCRVRTYPLVEKWRWIWLWMGDPEAADPAEIPDFHWNDDPEWTPTGGHFHIECNYGLLVDNLLDLSHETFVHPTTIGNAAVAETPVHTESDEAEVRVLRQINGQPAPPLYVKLKDFTGDIDRTQNITWTPPTNIVIESRSMPSGSNDPDMVLEYRVLNGITPATERTTHHFWATPRNFAPEEAVTEAFHEGSVRAFSEDVVVLEHQQATIEQQTASGGAPPRWIDINADRGGLLARSTMKRLFELEQADHA